MLYKIKNVKGGLTTGKNKFIKCNYSNTGKDISSINYFENGFNFSTKML